MSNQSLPEIQNNKWSSISEGARNLFTEYWKDRGNWNGTPCVGGNVEHTKIENGYLTVLKKHSLLTTFVDERIVWIEFTQSGADYAASLGLREYVVVHE